MRFLQLFPNIYLFIYFSLAFWDERDQCSLLLEPCGVLSSPRLSHFMLIQHTMLLFAYIPNVAYNISLMLLQRKSQEVLVLVRDCCEGLTSPHCCYRFQLWSKIWSKFGTCQTSFLLSAQTSCTLLNISDYKKYHSCQKVGFRFIRKLLNFQFIMTEKMVGIHFFSVKFGRKKKKKK